jgi:hypothetical protein
MAEAFGLGMLGGCTGGYTMHSDDARKTGFGSGILLLVLGGWAGDPNPYPAMHNNIKK